MKIKIYCCLLLPVILIMGHSVKAQDYFETVSQAYEHIFLAVIERGEVVRLGADAEGVECGNRYEAQIRRPVKGRLNHSRFTFFSTKRLTVGQSYLVYYSPADAERNRLSPSDTVDIVKCRSRMKGPLLTYKELHEITESWNGSSTDLVVEIDDVWAEYENITVKRQEQVLAKLDDVVHALIDAEKKH